MNMRKKKLLALMVTSAMMTCPVWADDTTAATGYESSGSQTVTSGSAAAPADDQKTAVNTVVTSPNDETTADAMKAAKSGLDAMKRQKNWPPLRLVRVRLQFSRKQQKPSTRKMKSSTRLLSIRRRRLRATKSAT